MFPKSSPYNPDVAKRVINDTLSKVETLDSDESIERWCRGLLGSNFDSLSEDAQKELRGRVREMIDQFNKDFDDWILYGDGRFGRDPIGITGKE